MTSKRQWMFVGVAVLFGFVVTAGNISARIVGGAGAYFFSYLSVLIYNELRGGV